MEPVTTSKLQLHCLSIIANKAVDSISGKLLIHLSSFYLFFVVIEHILSIKKV